MRSSDGIPGEHPPQVRASGRRNMGSKVLALGLGRLSQDWRTCYGHPERLTKGRRRALGIRRNAQRKYPAPSQTTFCRLFQRVDAAQINAAILAIQEQIRGPVPAGGLIVLDGKEPKHGPGEAVLTVIHAPSQYYLGSGLVDQKTNEIPVARVLMKPLDLRGRIVVADALHTQTETARMIVMEKGGDYILTVKDNQPTLRATIEKLIPAPEAGFSPSPAHPSNGPDGRVE